MTRATDGPGTSAVPPTSPYFAIPCVYRDVRFQIVRLRVPEAALARLLPEPLEGNGSGLCLVTSIDVPYSSSYGPFHESFLQLECRWQGQLATYLPYVFLDNSRAICAGREVYGTPKVWAEVSFEWQGDKLTSRTSIDGVDLIRQHIRAPRSIHPNLVPSDGGGPVYRLKLIPSADGRGASVKQLVTASPANLVMRDVWQGTGDVTLGVAGGIDLRALQPTDILTAHGFVASYVEGWGEIAFDYLA